MLAVALWATATYTPERIDSFGRDLIQHYVDRHADRQIGVLKALDQGSTEAAFDLLDDWQQIFKGDRLYPLKRMVYIKLSDQLDAADRGSELAMLAEQWMAEDDRDIAARAYSWQALTKDPATKDTGVAGLVAELAKFPNSPTLRWLHEAVVLSTLSVEEQNNYWAEQQTKADPAWQVFWDTGAGFSARQSTSAIAPIREQNSEWSVSVEIPASSINLRLDLPSESRMRLSELTLSAGQGRTLLDTKTLKTHMLKPQGDWLQTSGGNDPYVYFSLGELLPQGTNLVPVKISFMLARASDTRAAESNH